MTSASLQCLARVPCLGSSGIDREPAFVRTRARLRWRAHEGINPGLNRTKTPPAIQSVVALRLRRDGVITALSYQGGVNWRTAIERPQTHALAVRRFLQWGHTGLLNLFRRLQAAGSPFLRSLVQHPEKSGRSGFHTFSLSPIVLSFAAAHDEQHAAKEIPNVGKAVRKTGNV